MIIKKYKIINSTDIKAKELAKKGAEPWTVVVAESQDAGYGRKGAKWHSPKGGLYFSVVLPKSNIEDLRTLAILAAFIVAKVIKDNFQLEPFIKLPNDVYVNQKKTCGIIVENIIGKEVKLSVMGIGLNTNIKKFPKDLENIATSLRIELGKNIDNDKILKEIIEGLKDQLRTISE